MKLYTDDRLVHYKDTTINPMSTKAEIDGLLATFGIKKVMWEWDLQNNMVSVAFQISEVINNRTVEPVVKLEPPRIWSKTTRKHREEINWAVSMRHLWWFIKSHLEMAYCFQSNKTTEFLPHIQISETKTLKEVMFTEIKHFAALPEPRTIDVTPEETTQR